MRTISLINIIAKLYEGGNLMKKRMLSLFSLLLCACLLASCTIKEGPNYFWLAGETVRFSPAPTVSDFPPVFPELYYKSEENAAANPGITLCSNPSHFPYYEMVAIECERPADSEIRYFLMIGGNPGNMRYCWISMIPGGIAPNKRICACP